MGVGGGLIGKGSFTPKLVASLIFLSRSITRLVPSKSLFTIKLIMPPKPLICLFAMS